MSDDLRDALWASLNDMKEKLEAENKCLKAENAGLKSQIALMTIVSKNPKTGVVARPIPSFDSLVERLDKI